ncbi:MAG: flagellar biosynthetic protein FliO [Rubrivivax sp.]
MNGPGLTPLLWFFGILVLIPLVLWMVKRSPMGAQLSSGPVRQIGVLPLSPSQRLVTVEVGHGEERLWLVLGVTPNAIATLHTMAPQPAAPSAGSAAGGTPQATFAQLLQRLQGRGPDAR